MEQITDGNSSSYASEPPVFIKTEQTVPVFDEEDELTSVYDEATTNPKESIDGDWAEGQLAWARVGKWPYWPCLVCISPDGTFIEPASTGKQTQVRVHVRFLAYKGQRSWVPSNNIMPYTSIEDFENMKSEYLAKAKNKGGRQFIVANKNKLLWQQAVVEAQMLATIPAARRTASFEQNLAVEQSIQKQRNSSIKRLSIDSNVTLDEVMSEIDRRITSTQTTNSFNTNDVLSEPEMLSALKYEAIPDDRHIVSDDRLIVSQEQKVISNEQIIVSDILEPYNQMQIPNDDALVTHATVAGQLLVMENDLSFQEYFTKTKAYALMDLCDFSNEKYLKNLSLKIWLLTAMNELHKKTDVRNRPSNLPSVPLELRMNNNKSAAKRSVRKSSTISTSELEPFAKKIKIEKTLNASIDVDVVEEKMKFEASVVANRVAQAAAKDKRELEEISKYFMKQYPKNFLFKGLQKELVCRYCHQTGNLEKCQTTNCHEYLHHKCALDDGPEIVSLNSDAFVHVTADCDPLSMVGLTEQAGVDVTGDLDLLDIDGLTEQEILDEQKAYCPDCIENQEQVCFVCKLANGTELRCTEKKCGRIFHLECLQYWPQYKKLTNNQLLCPSHVCQTCTSDDPRAIHHRPTKNLTKCVQCPATFHTESACIPAGSILLTATQLICPRHRVDKRKRINTNWCFICSFGGPLIPCQTCPTAFHADCLQLNNIDDANYICEECESGRFPLYGEVVWVKMGNCKWWPAVVVPPTEIPQTVWKVKRQPHDFVVRYFGTRDFSWISRSFVFLYQEGDSECNTESDKLYFKSMVEAKAYATQLRMINEKFVDSHALQPPPYVKIKVNRPVHPVRLENNDPDSSKDCGCSPTDENPCGLNSDCMNQLLSIECDPETCPAGPLCQNQRFEKRIYANVEARRTEGKGWGLFAIDAIPARSFIIEYVGELINRTELNRRFEEMQRTNDEHYYFCMVTGNLVIDSRHQGNLSRFTNHSCEPNSKTQCWSVRGNTRIGLFALVDIPANTELTFNYQLESWGVLKRICRCGAKRCAGFIGASYVDPEQKPIKQKARKGRKRKMP